MADRLPSLDIIAREVRAERDAQFRHVDAVDAKAGIVLGFSGVLVAVGIGSINAYRIPGLLAALVAAGLAAAVFGPHRPAWDLRGLREERLRSEASFTELAMLDTHIEMVELQQQRLRRNARLLGLALIALLGAAALLVGGTIVDYLGG